ncbi:hypothetical protein [Winkia neuii]|uniref:Uncharacterized protein n=1 Tax=Winkia neuii subsp. anitrata TaxID=29318 RepID=A0AB38XMW9_9ACTO|nr:hypothetical protein [Winkia neuii]WCE45567.1 hypothetical protein PIG85_07875 [Winkia neuii subsp. anitrata]
MGHHETLHHGKPAEMDIGVSHDAALCGMRRISLAVAVTTSAAQLLKSALSTLLSLLRPRPRLRHS